MTGSATTRVALVNVPFGAVDRPAIGLTQLRSVCLERHNGAVQVDLHYLNNDFARLLGSAIYEEIASGTYYTTGLGDWLFRQIAFPQAADNIDAYLARYFPAARFHETIRADRKSFRSWLEDCRRAFADLLHNAIRERELDRYDVVGCTSSFSQTGACLALARLVKERNPDVRTVIGGANCEGSMGAALAEHIPWLDCVCCGPGLTMFPQFVDDVHNGRPLARRLWIGAERPISTTPVQLDYDAFLDAFDAEVRNLDVEPTLLFETSRGCWWGEVSQCTFCGLNGLTMAYRAAAVEQAVEAIRSLFRYRDRCTSLMGVDNIMPREFIRDVLPHLGTPADVTIFYEVKANLGRAQLKTAAAAGVRRLQPGIESLSTAHLRLMRKGTTSFRNIRLLENCRTVGIEVLWNLLVGLPGEDEQPYQHYAQALPLLFHLPPPSDIYPIRFDRFSPYFEQAAEFDLNLRPADFYRLTYPLPDRFIECFAYYFVDDNLDAGYRPHLAKWLRPLREIVADWKRRWADDRPPELSSSIVDGRVRVRDSRREPVSHLLTDAEVATLASCHTPIRLRGSRGARFDPDALETLRERGLLFEDDGKVMSLLRLPRAV